jgi:hypothetical protein
LKLPEVVVKGERQFQVTAERRDLLLQDPMSGTKEIPSDFAELAVPGLEQGKSAPAAETITAKNHLIVAEAGAGFHHAAEGRLIAGQELAGWNYLLNAEYAAEEFPAAFGFTPFQQDLIAGLDVHVTAFAKTDLAASFSGQGQSGRQPSVPGGWGDWLKQGTVRGGLQTEFELGSFSHLNLAGGVGSYVAQGAGTVPAPSWRAGLFQARVGYAQEVHGLFSNPLILAADLDVRTQQPDAVGALSACFEALKTLTVTARLRPAEMLHLDFGVRMDDFQGGPGQSAANANARISLSLPTGTTLFGNYTPGLVWSPVSEWMLKQPHPVVPDRLPRPENVRRELEAGWRQSWGQAVSTEFSWFWRQAHDTPVFLDLDHKGLFSYVNLEESRIQGGRAELEVRYLPALSQTFQFLLRQADAGPDRKLPNVPAQEARSELKLTLPPLEVGVTYRWLGERFSDPALTAADLQAAHLLGLKCDLELVRGWNVFLRAENLLNSSWEEWRGYSGRGVSALGGIRVYF